MKKELMSDMNKFEEDVEFVTRYYDENAFKPTLMFKSPGILRSRRMWRTRWIAASVAFVTLTAAAIVIGYQQKHSEPEQVPAQKVTVAPPVTDHSHDVVILEFEDAPISEVARVVEETYGVTLGNVPEDDIHLTLRYEGNAYDFIEAVNEIINTNIEIVEGKETAE